MRFIVKKSEPRALIRWKANNEATPQNLIYGGGQFPAEGVRRHLMSEQLHLCAYTMKRLRTAAECEAKELDTRSSCHIEHILPQARKKVGEDIDYRNMVACFPPSLSQEACEFGAKWKDDFDPMNAAFISPLSPQVEQHFRFNEHGNISGLTAEGDATVRVLNLEHAALVHDRAAVIKGMLKPNGKPLSAAAARRLAIRVLQPDEQGCLTAYCVAIASAATAFAVREERRAARMRRNRRAR